MVIQQDTPFLLPCSYTTITIALEQQQHIKQLHEQNWSQAAIAQAIGASIRTVQRYVKQPNFPATLPHHQSFGQSILDPYKARFLEWWNEGIRQPTVLVSLLKAQGYKGSSRTVTRYISHLRQAQGLPVKHRHSPQSSIQVSDPQSPPLTARRASYLTVQHKENRADEDQVRLEQLVAAHPDLASAVELADAFLRLLRQRQGNGLDAWLMQALKSKLKPL